MMAAIIILLFGVSERVNAQVYVVTYQLNNSVAKRADGLKKFYHEGELIKRYNANQITVFEMKCCSDSTFLVYLPVYSEDGRRTDCCPRMTLYLKRGKWRADNMPADKFAYNRKESKNQAKIISRALDLLHQNPTSKN